MTIATLLPIADTWSMHDGVGWGIWMMVVMVLFVGAIIIGAVWFGRGTANASDSPRRQTPSDILDQRFAEGAISVEDYEARKDVLAGATSAHKPT
jgi:uncharacterized membrane protein